ncbi:hypothetical protein ABC347_08360 [Sphingomonas sp. 1P06PA]|uniref:hypothetical protein n=1 Tax=Sphingomonas sp. 1P06PA TaxID=554121 RepID=UPI0039A72666
MDPFTMVVAIVGIVSLASVIRGKRRHRHDEEAIASPDTDRMREEVRTLKERVAVLERIATDANNRAAMLDHEIELLRGRD